MQKRLKSNKICSETTNTTKQQKLKIGQKRQKLLKPIENSLERVLMTKKQNNFFFLKHLLPIRTKRQKPLKTC